MIIMKEEGQNVLKLVKTNFVLHFSKIIPPQVAPWRVLF